MFRRLCVAASLALLISSCCGRNAEPSTLGDEIFASEGRVIGRVLSTPIAAGDVVYLVDDHGLRSFSTTTHERTQQSAPFFPFWMYARAGMLWGANRSEVRKLAPSLAKDPLFTVEHDEEIVAVSGSEKLVYVATRQDSSRDNDGGARRPPRLLRAPTAGGKTVAIPITATVAAMVANEQAITWGDASGLHTLPHAATGPAIAKSVISIGLDDGAREIAIDGKGLLFLDEKGAFWRLADGDRVPSPEVTINDTISHFTADAESIFYVALPRDGDRPASCHLARTVIWKVRRRDGLRTVIACGLFDENTAMAQTDLDLFAVEREGVTRERLLRISKTSEIKPDAGR